MTASSTLRVRVRRKTVEALDICSFELVDASGAALPPFSAGSHIDVHGPTGIVRQYSLCNDPNVAGHYLIGVLRDAASRGGSMAMHEQVNEGDLLEISAPKNHFPLVHDANFSLLLAGGIGVTPILCMAERLSNTGAAFEMHYLARSRERMAFRERIEGSAFAAQAKLHCDGDPLSLKPDLPTLLTRHLDGTHLYVCGPSGFLEHVLTTARGLGWPEDHLHFEFFGATVEDDAADQPFDVRIASTGAVCTVPAGRSVLHALADIGIEVPFSCEQGVCGTCLTAVLSGKPDHRDHFLTEAERAANDQFTPCCSRSRSPLLVLDL